jgi:AmmeMemoRadiSam system protein A
MVLTRSLEYPRQAREHLLGIARAAIEHGMVTRSLLALDEDRIQGRLAEVRASFVSLTFDGSLRGCTGTLDAHYPLAEGVARNALRTAFDDSRFAPITSGELAGLVIEIAVLSPLERIDFSGERELLGKLRPCVDGLVLEVGGQRTTFLPKVWEHLSEPDQFVAQLKDKAGLPEGRWRSGIHAYRYEVESFSDASRLERENTGPAISAGHYSE